MPILDRLESTQESIQDVAKAALGGSVVGGVVDGLHKAKDYVGPEAMDTWSEVLGDAATTAVWSSLLIYAAERKYAAMQMENDLARATSFADYDQIGQDYGVFWGRG